MLSATGFARVVRDTPLVSIDLVVLHNSKALLGKRCNEPAKGYWFVPGGRIRKNESINKAFYRLTGNELDMQIPVSDAEFLGVYEHFYATNFSESGDFGTHYVVLAYTIRLASPLTELPTQQHSDYRWFEIDKIKEEVRIHQHTKAYFR